MPSWSSPVEPPPKRKQALKRGSRSQADPPDGSGGTSPGARDGRARATKTLPFGMVRVEASAPSGCRPMPGRETGRPARARNERSPQGRVDRARRSAPHRRAMGVGESVVAAPKGRGRQSAPRPPRGARRDLVGGEDRIILARDAGGVRQMGESLPTPRAVGEAGLVAAYPPDL